MAYKFWGIVGFAILMCSINVSAQEIIKEEHTIEPIDTLANNQINFTLGYGYRTAQVSDVPDPELKQHIKNLKSGFNLNLNYSHYISPSFGPSLKYSYFYASSTTHNFTTTTNIFFIGGGVSSRQMIGETVLLSATVHLGYAHFRGKDTIDALSFELTGQTLGLDGSIDVNIFLSRQLSLQFQLGYLDASLNKFKDSSGNSYEFEEYESLSRIDLNMGLKYNF